MKKRQKLITESWFSFPQYTWQLSRCIQNLKTLAVIGAETSVTKRFIGEKEKRTNKGSYWFSFTQYNKSYPTFVPNFKILRAKVPEKSLTQISLCITLEWEMEKRKNGKKIVKINLSIFVFCPTIYLATLKVYKKFEDFGSQRSREICNRKFDWGARKMDK